MDGGEREGVHRVIVHVQTNLPQLREYNSFTYIIGTCICVYSRRVGGQKMMTG